MEALTLLDAARMGLGGFIAALGLVIILGGTIGLLRFPDFYTRVHATSVSDASGAAVFVVGLAVMAPDFAMAVRLLLFAALMVALGPAFTHLLASSAHAGGLAPIVGRYIAPRPGAPRRAEPLE